MTAARKERHHGHASPRGLNLHGELRALIAPTRFAASAIIHPFQAVIRGVGR